MSDTTPEVEPYVLIGGKDLDAIAEAEWKAQVVVDAATPPVFGRPIAWAECPYNGVTGSISEVHRVGVPNGDKPYTTCGIPIPEARMWVPLSPAMVDAMKDIRPAGRKGEGEHLRRCKFCAADASHFLTENAA